MDMVFPDRQLTGDAWKIISVAGCGIAGNRSACKRIPITGHGIS
jgi:hypothetical protein